MWRVALGRTVVFVARRAAAACLRKSREWGGAVVNGIVACRRRVVTVTEVVPANGPTARTNRVTVSGTNFDPNPTVTFGADLGGNVSRQDAQTILVDVPRRNAGAGAVAVTVTNT